MTRSRLALLADFLSLPGIGTPARAQGAAQVLWENASWSNSLTSTSESWQLGKRPGAEVGATRRASGPNTMSSSRGSIVLRLLPFLLGAALAAQAPSWSPEWATAGLGGTVFAFADYNGELFAGGSWSETKGGVIRGLARFDGSDWHAVGTGIDLVNYSFPPRDTQVSAMAVYNGELVFAGTFDQVDGQAMNYIARWNGTTLQPLGGGLRLSYDEADVRALAVYNNELYAAGEFDLAGGQPANGIARWNGATWSPVGTGLQRVGSGTPGYGRALHVYNGSLIVGGEFDRAGGAVVDNIARWNGSNWSAMGIGSFAPVYALETFGTQLIAAGQFQLGSGVAMPGAWDGFSWSALGGNPAGIPSFALRTFGPHLYADSGGALSRWDGGAWSTAGLVSGIFSGYQGTSIRALHVHGTDLMLGGEFTDAGPAPNQMTVASSNVAAFDGSAGWRALGGGQGLDRRIDRLLAWRSGWVAAGPFSEAGTAPAVGLAFFDGDRWNLLGRVGGGIVYDVAVYQGNVVLSGNFTNIDGQPFPGSAQFDGTQWLPFAPFGPVRMHAHGSGLYACGGSALTRWNGSAFVPVATAPTGTIDRLHSHSDGLLYATNDESSAHRILVWNGTQLVPIGTANDYLQTISSYGNDVVVGGRFTAVNGVPAALMARWDGTAWHAMPAPVSGYATYAFGEMDGDLYAGVSGDPRGHCLRLHSGTWQPLGSDVDGVPSLFFVDRATASVYVSGDILSAGGLPSQHFAEWRTQPTWRNRLHGTAGAAGIPLLSGRGTAQGGQLLTWTVEGPPNTVVALGAGTQRIDLPIFGALLVPSPDAIVLLATDATGAASLPLVLVPSMPPGYQFWSQAWLVDATGPQGLTATNGLECTTL
jgi:hypothetical protein